MTIEPARRGYFEELYTSESEPWRYSERAIERLRHEFVAERAAALAPRRALELGCSLGALTERLALPHVELFSLDISPTAVRSARARLAGSAAPPPSFLVGAATAIPLREQYFDLVIASDGPISWFLPDEERRRVPFEAHRMLAPGGHLLLTDFGREPQFRMLADEVAAARLEIVSIEYFHDRMWYQFESWFAAVPDSRIARALLGSMSIARMLRGAARLRGVRGARHVCITARRPVASTPH